MPDAEHIAIDISPDLAAELRAAVAGGDYRSVSEAIEDALHDWHIRREVALSASEDLRRMVQAGVDSGAGLDPDEVFARLRARIAEPPVA